MTPVLPKVALDETKQTIAKAKGPSTLAEDLTTEASRRVLEHEDEDAERSWETEVAILEPERAKLALEADGPPTEPKEAKDAPAAAPADAARTEAEASPTPNEGEVAEPAAEEDGQPTGLLETPS